jgi:uncharacterized protein with gpF-like domain
MRTGRTVRGGAAVRDSGIERAPTLARAESGLAVVLWTQWQTADDERVCPECGPLHGLAWPEDDGPQPPLHVNCRCWREPVFMTWRVRQRQQPVARP